MNQHGDNMDILYGDLRAEYTDQKRGNGFASVYLYDADDYDEFWLAEDSAIALYHYLQQKLKEDGLI